MKNKEIKKKINKKLPEKSLAPSKQKNQPLINGANKTPYYALFIMVFALYANSLFNQYALDDRLTITENQFTKQGVSGMGDILSNDSFVGFFGKQKNLVAGGRYRPLSLITFALEYQLFGLNAFISHLVNILLYALCCMIIYKVLTMLFQQQDKRQKWYLSIPFIATALFIAHPLHVEAVANIKGRDEIMSLLGSMAALYFVLKSCEGKRISNLLWASLCFFLGIMSKENAITFIAIIPLTLYFFNKSTLRHIFVSTATLLFVASLFIMIRYRALGFFVGGEIDYELLNNPFLGASAAQKFATVLLTWGKYLILLLFPHPLTHDYYPKQIPIIEMSDVRAIIPLLIYLAMIVFALIKFRKKSIVSFGILFFGLTFSISSNLVFPIGTFMNDRFMFVPLLGFTLIIAYYLNQWMHKKSSEKAVFVIAGFLFLAYSVKTIARNPVWYDDYTLFTTDVKVSDNSAKCNVSAGGQTLELAEKEKDQVKKKEMIADAIEFLNKGITIHPKYTAGWVLLGRAMLDLEEYGKAREYYKIALKIVPTQSEALNNWLYCAQMSSKNKDYKEAAISYSQLIKYQPKNEDLYVQLATVYENDAKTDSALMILDTLLKKNPQSAPALSKKGEIYGKVLNNIDQSLEYLLKAYTISPTDASLLENLGIAYGIKKNFDKSISFFEKAIEADPEKSSILSNMSSTYNMMGNTAKATECLQKAAALQKKEK